MEEGGDFKTPKICVLAYHFIRSDPDLESRSARMFVSNLCMCMRAVSVKVRADHSCGSAPTVAHTRRTALASSYPQIMSLACLVCHVESPSESFRSYSVSSSDSEGRCTTIVNCWNKKFILSAGPNATTTSKVAPQPLMGNDQDLPSTPRLLRSHAVRRDLFRDWNFDDSFVENHSFWHQ